MNQDPRSRLYNTESWVSIESPALAEKLAGLFEESIEAHHSFRRRLRNGALEWITSECGGEVRYGSEPLALRGRRFLSRLTSALIPEVL